MPPRGHAVNSHNHNHNRERGVLQLNPGQAQVNNNNNASGKSTVRLKLEVRRLPPALTKDEFLEAFGGEWKPAAGKVDWLQYRAGKVKTGAKISEQSRAYLHLTNESHIKPFEAKFLSVTFHDAKGTHKDQNLRHLTPTLGFAPSQRVPTAKPRVDGRQGTIDQDPEFIAFLEGETQPVTKAPALDAAVGPDKPKDTVTSTPLLDDLRERKAAKAKAAAEKPIKAPRGGGGAKEDKAVAEKQAHGKDAPAAKGGKGAKAEAAVKDGGKAGVKGAAKGSAANASSPASTPAAQQSATPRKRERATPQSIKSMLARDLGLETAPKRERTKAAVTATDTTSGPPPASARAAPAPAVAAATATTTAAAAAAASTDSPAPNVNAAAKPAKSTRGSRKASNLADKSNGQAATQDSTSTAKPTPTGILKKPVQQQTPKGSKGKAANASTPAATTPAPKSSASPATPTQGATAKPSKPAPQPSAGATKAYLKHANASQGITEPLVTTALSAFGELVRVDIDKRKGTALAEFKSPQGLKAAMARRSVPIAQGAVEVLEYRERPAQAPRANASNSANGAAGSPTTKAGGSAKGKGRGGRGNAASAASAASTAVAAAAAAAATSPATAAPSAPASASPAATPAPADGT